MKYPYESLRSAFHFGRRKTDIPRMSCALAERISDGGLTTTTDTIFLLIAYRDGSHFTSDIVGLIDENNIITLTDKSLASGNYTLYYEDSNRDQLENWSSIGKISK